MKKLYIITSILILLLLISLTAKSQEEVKEYIHHQGIFSINYPSDWSSQKTGQEVILFSPNKDKKNGLTVIYGSILPGYSLNIDSLSEEFKKTFTDNLSEIKDIELPQKTNINGTDAIIYHITGNVKNAAKEMFIITSINKGTLFIIIAYGTKEDFSKYKEIFLKMIETFKTYVTKINPENTPVIEDINTDHETTHVTHNDTKIEGWNLFNDISQKLSFQYPSDFKIEREDYNNIIEFKFFREKPFNLENSIILHFFTASSEENKKLKEDKLSENLSLEMAALGYEIIEKSSLNLENIFTATMIKCKKENKNITLIGAIKEGHFIQMYINEYKEEDILNKEGKQIIESIKIFQGIK